MLALFSLMIVSKPQSFHHFERPLEQPIQIRVHLEHLRCPVLGDPLYGDASRNKLEAKRATRPLLHAHLLQLAHPITDAPLRVCAPPPEDISAVAATLAGCEPEQLATWLQPKLDAALESNAEEFDELVAKYVV